MKKGIRGWLLVYVIALAIFSLHALGLTIASLIINAHPSLVGMQSFIPLGALLFYVITNLIEVVYAIVLFVFLLSWHFIGEKSIIGTFVDALPGLIGVGYFLASKRVRNTFVG
jgi:Ca2+/H+ antiporter